MKIESRKHTAIMKYCEHIVSRCCLWRQQLRTIDRDSGRAWAVTPSRKRGCFLPESCPAGEHCPEYQVSRTNRERKSPRQLFAAADFKLVGPERNALFENLVVAAEPKGTFVDPI